MICLNQERENNKKTIRRLDLTRGVLILTLILYFVVILVINSSYLTVDRLMRLRSNVSYALNHTVSDTVRLEADDTVSVELFQDGYAILTRNGITVLGGDGNEYSSHTLQYKQPRMKVCGKYILCFDRGGTGWSLLNSFRVLCSGTSEGDLISASVCDDGYFALATEGTEYKGSVTVYNTDGLPLSRWNSTSYLLESFFIGRNRLAVVSVASVQETTDTVFTSFQFKKGEVDASVTVPDTFPLALSLKRGEGVEMLTSTGAIVFDGETAVSVYSYPEPSPGLFRQGEDATVISYQTASGALLVEAFSAKGERLFSKEYSSVFSLDCANGYFFLLTPTELLVLDATGTEVLRSDSESASRVLVSAEISALIGSNFITRLDLSSLP